MSPHAKVRRIGTARTVSDRALSATDIENLVRARRAGARVVDLAREYGVSRRTIYRWLHAEIRSCEIGGYRALFAIRRPEDSVREGPVQVSEWVPVE